MDENLIKLLTDQMTPGVLGKLSGVLGESDEATGKAVNAAIPGIMGMLMKKGANESGANELMGMMDNLPGGLDLGNIAGLLSNQEQSKTLLNSGNGLVSGLLGGSNNKMFDLISSVSGIGRAKSGNLMGLLMPLAMGMLKGKMRGNGLGAAGLASMLLGQRNFLKAAAPNGLTEALGLSSFDDIGSNIGQSANVNVGLNDVAGNVGNTVSGAVEGGTERIRGAAGNVGGAVKGAGAAVGAGAAATAAAGGKVARSGMGIGRWLLPLIGLLALLAILWWLFTSGPLSGNKKAMDVNVPGTGAVTGTVDGVSGAVSGAVDGTAGAVSGAVDGVTGAVSGAVDGATGAVDGAAGAVSGAVDGATGAVSGAVDGAAGAVSGTAAGVAGAVAGAIPANVLSGVCGSVSGLTSSFDAFPALTAETDTSAVVAGVNAVRTPIEGILAAAGDLNIPGLNNLTTGFNGLRSVVEGIAGGTLGASAGAVGEAFDGLKTAGTGFTDSLNCSN